MLILTRCKDESIIVNTSKGQVEVMITQIRGKAVRLGIIAPANIAVNRKEVQLQIDREKKDGA